MSLLYLKVKRLSLADEARTIRRLEKRKKKTEKAQRKYHKDSGLNTPFVSEFEGRGLHHRRTVVVRKEARAAHLAYMFLKGVPYASVESKCNEQPDWGRVVDIAEKFCDVSRWEEDILDSVDEWANHPKEKTQD
jgi:hypothetical protein